MFACNNNELGLIWSERSWNIHLLRLLDIHQKKYIKNLKDFNID